MQLKSKHNFHFLFLILLLFVQSCSLGQEGALSIEAGLVYRAGDVKPVARTEFYLLDDSLENILKNAQFKSSIDQLSILQNYALLQYAKVNFASTMPETTKSQISLTDNAVKPHIVSTLTTDFNGKGVFPAVKKGQYYLMGIGEAGKQIVVWNLPVKIESSNQSITLDNKNAADVFGSHL